MRSELSAPSPFLQSNLVRQFRRFMGVGALCFLINLAILWLGTSVLHAHYLLALVASIIVCNTVGFALNRTWTFEANDELWGQLKRYLVVNAGAMLLNFALMALFVSVFGLSVMLASVVVAVLLMFLNFVLHGRWSFGARKSKAY